LFGVHKYGAGGILLFYDVGWIGRWGVYRVVNSLVGATLALLVLLVVLWLALATGLVGYHLRPDWSCIDSNLAGEPPPCAYRAGE
jgi:hypothetical protein